jgi:hypothetical protein
MSGPDRVEVRDRRRPPFFMIDNHVLDRCAKQVGVTAWAVYCVLVRWAINTRKPQLSVKTIAETLGISLRTAKRAKQKLEKSYLIRSHKTQSISIIELLEVTQLDFNQGLFSGGATSVPTEKQPERPPAAPRTGHQRPLPEATNVPTSFKTLKTLKTSSFTRGETVSRPGKAPAAPPRFSQSDFDERDYRKWRKEMQELQKNGASVGTNIRPDDPDELEEWEAEQDEIWISNARKAAARAGILPRRIVEILKQVYPEDPNVPKIDQRRKKA